MNRPTKDLFDDTSMTFGEHLEVLRVHLIKAIIGLVIAVVICLFNGTALVNVIRRPIDKALAKYSVLKVEDDVEEGLAEQWGLDTLKELLWGDPNEVEEDPEIIGHPDRVKVKVRIDDLERALAKLKSPESDDESGQNSTAEPNEPQKTGETNTKSRASTESEVPEEIPSITLTLAAPEFAQFQATVKKSRQAVTLNVQEAFLTYVKVSLISGVVLASPWIFFQVWQFVAAGLYPHERKFVHVYGTMSLVLFLFGAAFCFYAVFPFVLSFLLKFNATLEIAPQIRISEWISFAVMLPLMFGVSFQLPLAMLFLERISIFQVQHYKEQRRMAVLVIAILSMLLTPADPMSMLLMMIPLIFLYELGIKLCQWSPAATPFEADPLE